MNLAIIYGADDGEPYWMRNYAPDMPRPTRARRATLNIELQKRTPSRHRGNYYACGHRWPRTNNPELRKRERERELKTYCLSPCARAGPVRKSGKFGRWISRNAGGGMFRGEIMQNWWNSSKIAMYDIYLSELGFFLLEKLRLKNLTSEISATAESALI